jgi:hypothetical protein
MHIVSARRSIMRYDALLPQDTIPDYICPRDNFYFYLLLLFFLRKKTLKLTRGTTLPHRQDGQELCLGVAKDYIMSTIILSFGKLGIRILYNHAIRATHKKGGLQSLLVPSRWALHSGLSGIGGPYTLSYLGQIGGPHTLLPLGQE